MAVRSAAACTSSIPAIHSSTAATHSGFTTQRSKAASKGWLRRFLEGEGYLTAIVDRASRNFLAHRVAITLEAMQAVEALK